MKQPASVATTQSFAWVLCVEDDEPAKRSLDYLKSIRE
jgi:hypothetical protein